MKKTLYIDLPFSEEQDSSKARSRFLWEVLSKSSDADLLLVKTEEYLTKTVPEHKGFEQLHSLASARMNPIKPSALYQFSKDNLDKFRQILHAKRYEIILFMWTNCRRNLQRWVIYEGLNCWIWENGQRDSATTGRIMVGNSDRYYPGSFKPSSATV